MFYIILFLFFLLVTLFALWAKNRKVERFLAVSLTLIIIFFGTIRWKTGYDWYFYLRFYTYIKNYIDSYSDLKVSFEPIFTSFYFLAKATGIGFILVQFIQIFIISTLKFSIYKRYTPYIVLAIFLNFMMFADMVTVRNFLAGSIALYSLKYVETKRILPFLIAILIAINIHYSAILAFLFYPIYHTRFSIGIKSIFLLLAIVIGLTGVFGMIFGFLGSSVSGGGTFAYKLNVYAELMEDDNLDETSPVIIVLGIVRRIIVFPIIFYFEEKYFKKDKLFRGVSSLFVFGNVIYFIVGNDLRIFQRMSIPFYLCEVLLLVWIFAKVKVKSIYFTFLLLYGMSKFSYIYINNQLVYPYITIFNPNEPQAFWDKYGPPKPFKE